MTLFSYLLFFLDLTKSSTDCLLILYERDENALKNSHFIISDWLYGYLQVQQDNFLSPKKLIIVYDVCKHTLLWTQTHIREVLRLLLTQTNGWLAYLFCMIYTSKGEIIVMTAHSCSFLDTLFVFFFLFFIIFI